MAGGTAHFVRCDVTSEEEVRALIQTTEELIGGIDALVTSAGVLQAAAVPVEEIDPADWTRTLEVNVYGSFYCVKHALPALRRSPSGVVVLLGSGAGIFSGSSSVPYAASKGGVYGLVEGAGSAAGRGWHQGQPAASRQASTPHSSAAPRRP